MPHAPELSPDQKLFLAAVVRRFPRYGTEYFDYPDIPPSSIKPGMTDAEAKKVFDELVGMGRIKKGGAAYSLTQEARDEGHQAAGEVPPPKKKSLYELTNHQVIGGVIAGLILAGVLLGIGWVWGRLTAPASQVAAPASQPTTR